MTRRAPFVLGLTGSIGMGKTTTANMFRQLGVPVWDADAVVHQLYEPDGAAVPVVAGLVPDAVVGNAVDRNILRDATLHDSTLLPRLEAVVHPLVAADRRSFLDQSADPVVLLDVPLLFETGTDANCDAVITVTAPPEVQRDRVLSRPGMTQTILDNILARQTPDAEKRARADFVLDTSLGLATTQMAVQTIVETVAPGSR